MSEFTDKESKWISAADRLFERIPKDLMLYVCDGDIVVCKKGANCGDLSDKISGSNINCCCVVQDVHDDLGYGA